jgi:hypothetical protein
MKHVIAEKLVPPSDKDLRNIKFLETVKMLSLANKDLAIPYDRPDLYQTQMFTMGVVEALISSGYKIEKETK